MKKILGVLIIAVLLMGCYDDGSGSESGSSTNQGRVTIKCINPDFTYRIAMGGTESYLHAPDIPSNATGVDEYVFDNALSTDGTFISTETGLYNNSEYWASKMDASIGTDYLCLFVGDEDNNVTINLPVEGWTLFVEGDTTDNITLPGAAVYMYNVRAFSEYHITIDFVEKKITVIRSI